jgi:hypothetical protein
MPMASSIAARERAEICAIRAAVIALLKHVEEIKPGIIDGLKRDLAAGVNFKPAVDEFLVPDKMLRQRLSALLSESQ